MKNLFSRKKDAWEEYLFREHSEEFLSSWARRLKYFRFFRALGGHANDADKIVLALGYDGQEDLIWLLNDLGIPYLRFPEKPQQPEPRKRYAGSEFEKFPLLIPGTVWIEQPKRKIINAIEVFIWGYQERIEFSVIGSADKRWDIGETEFQHAEALEPVFEKYASRMIDPPYDTKNFICPKYYPQYWE
jgi:hypothetical protein